jgi:hypothetical protein
MMECGTEITIDEYDDNAPWKTWLIKESTKCADRQREQKH